MPKEHFPSIDDVPNDILLAMLETAKALATQEGFSNGYRIVINKGPMAVRLFIMLMFIYWEEGLLVGLQDKADTERRERNGRSKKARK